MIIKIDTPLAPKAIGPYSQAMVYNGIVYTSGQIAIDPESGEMVKGDIVAQTNKVLENIIAVLAAADSVPSLAIKTTCYLKDMADFQMFNTVYETVFTDKPARSCVAVKELPKNALVEIEVIAVVKTGALKK